MENDDRLPMLEFDLKDELVERWNKMCYGSFD